MRTLPEVITTCTIGDQEIQRDGHGYLIDPGVWSREVAEAFAKEEGVEMTEEHWAIVHFMRDYLEEHGIAVDARLVFTFLADYKGQSKKQARQHFFTIFPYGYVKQACKIAGMRQPRVWSTG